MERERFLTAVRGKTIGNVILSDETLGEPVKIIKIITTDGYHIDTENSSIMYPAYDNELAEFIEKINKAKPDSFFEMRAQVISIDEMRKYADEHRKKINANGGNVNQIYNGNYKVSFGEDLDALKRNH